MFKRLLATALLVSAVAIAPGMAQNAAAQDTPPAKPMKTTHHMKHHMKHHKAMPKKTTMPKETPY